MSFVWNFQWSRHPPCSYPRLGDSARRERSCFHSVGHRGVVVAESFSGILKKSGRWLENFNLCRNRRSELLRTFLWWLEVVELNLEFLLDLRCSCIHDCGELSYRQINENLQIAIKTRPQWIQVNAAEISEISRPKKHSNSNRTLNFFVCFNFDSFSFSNSFAKFIFYIFSWLLQALLGGRTCRWPASRARTSAMVCDGSQQEIFDAVATTFLLGSAS